jgi:hypothetical protein
VKVDAAMMQRMSGQDKENMRPSQAAFKSETQQKSEAEQLKGAQAEQLPVEKEAEKRRAEERRKQNVEDARLQQEAAAAEECRAREEAAAEVARSVKIAAAAEEERLRQESLQVAEEKAENEAAAEKDRQRVEEAKRVARTKVIIWCRDNGYQNATTPKKTFKGNTKFALHTAVKQENPEMVNMLMLCGAARDVKDSKGQTPLQLGEKMKKGKSRDQIIEALR